MEICPYEIENRDFVIDSHVGRTDHSNDNPISIEISEYTMDVIRRLHKLEKQDAPEPNPYSISTQSIAAKLTPGTYNCKLIAEKIPIKKQGIGIMGVSLMNVKEKIRIVRGCLVNKQDKKKTIKEKFNNQFTMIIRTSPKCNANLKLFSNGGVSMTGCKSINDGTIALGILCHELKKAKLVPTDLKEKLGYRNFKVSMMNADFVSNINLIERYKLTEILKNDYGLYVDFEPTRYAGIKLVYMYNKNNTSEQRNGVCHCKTSCEYNTKTYKYKMIDGDKCNYDGNKACLRVMVAIFRTGNVIITGSRNDQQLNEVYDNVINWLKESYNKIVRFRIDDVLTDEEKKLTVSVPDLNQIIDNTAQLASGNENGNEKSEGKRKGKGGKTKKLKALPEPESKQEPTSKNKKSNSKNSNSKNSKRDCEKKKNKDTSVMVDLTEKKTRKRNKIKVIGQGGVFDGKKINNNIPIKIIKITDITDDK